MKQRILFLNWKDITHPSAGGAELLTDVLAERLALTHNVTYFTSRYPGAKSQEIIHGYSVIRRGTVYSVYAHAFFWWHSRKIYAKQFTRIIDQVHGIPFFSLLYYRHPPVYTLVMEIADTLWNTTYNALIAFIGKRFEDIWLALYKTKPIITISKSTKREIVSHGFSPDTVSIIPMFTHVHSTNIQKKATDPTLLFVGRIAPVKQVEDAITAYKISQKRIPKLKLVIIGKTEPAYEKYASQVVQKITDDPGIIFIGNASEEQKVYYLTASHLLLMPSRKEGYGLVILEAAACGTPAIGYSVPGIQDAIIDKQTGVLVAKNNPNELAKSICEILTDNARYTDMQNSSFTHALERTKERTSLAFERCINV